MWRKRMGKYKKNSLYGSYIQGINANWGTSCFDITVIFLKQSWMPYVHGIMKEVMDFVSRLFMVTEFVYEDEDEGEDEGEEVEVDYPDKNINAY